MTNRIDDVDRLVDQIDVHDGRHAQAQLLAVEQRGLGNDDAALTQGLDEPAPRISVLRLRGQFGKGLIRLHWKLNSFHSIRRFAPN